MEPKIRRKFKAIPVTLTTSSASSTTLRFDDIAGGSLEMGTVATNVTTIQCWGSDAITSTYGRIYNADGSAADITLAPSATEARVYSLPDACFGVGALRLVANHTLATAAVCIVTLKT